MKLLRYPVHSWLAAVALALCGTAASRAAQVDTPQVFPPDPEIQTALVDGARLPELKTLVEPVDPPEAKALKRAVRVYVSFVVTKDGKVVQVSPMFCPPKAFADAAVAAVEQWEFSPGLHYHGNGSGKMVPVRTQMTVLVTFSAP